MIKILNSNLAMKILSVVFAVLLWFIALNTSNPFISRSYVIPLKLDNVNSLSEKNIGIAGKVVHQNAVVDIKGRQNVLDKVSESNFKALVDFSKINKPGDRELPVNIVKRGKGIQIVDVKPSAIQVGIEKITSETFPVQLEREGTVKENYFVTGLTSKPDSIEIEDVESVIGSIDMVKASVKYDNLSENISSLVNCKVYNKKGEEITEFNKKFSVNVNLNVAKKVPLKPVVEGVPEKYFVVGEKSIMPDSILIQGQGDVLESIDHIKCEPVNIDGLSENLNVPVSLQLPDGARLTDNSAEIKVEVELEEMDKIDYYIPESRIRLKGLNNLYEYNMVNPGIIIELICLNRDLNKINSGYLTFTVDVQDYEEGIHELPLNIQVPESIYVDKSYDVEVEIKKATEEITPSPGELTPSPEITPSPEEI